MAVIFVQEDLKAEVGPAHEAAERVRQHQAIGRYTYGGSTYLGWGTCPHCSRTGFFYDVPEHPGFGPDQTLARLASGLHFGHRVQAACPWCEHPHQPWPCPYAPKAPTSEEAEYAEDHRCRTEGCPNDPDDGEGYDGFCGNCEDRHFIQEGGL